MDNTFTCEICGNTHPVSECTKFGGQNLCPHCLEEHTLVCTRCGERIWREDNAGTTDTPLCDNCYTYHYTICSRCGRLLRNDEAYYEDEDDDNSLCFDCFHSNAHGKAIRDYYYKPAPIFYGKGPATSVWSWR